MVRGYCEELCAHYYPVPLLELQLQLMCLGLKVGREEEIVMS